MRVLAHTIVLFNFAEYNVDHFHRCVRCFRNAQSSKPQETRYRSIQILSILSPKTTFLSDFSPPHPIRPKIPPKIDSSVFHDSRLVRISHFFDRIAIFFKSESTRTKRERWHSHASSQFSRILFKNHDKKENAQNLPSSSKTTIKKKKNNHGDTNPFSPVSIKKKYSLTILKKFYSTIEDYNRRRKT